MHLGDVESDYPGLDEGLEFAFFMRKQALVPSDETASNIFDGGETVYVKIVDDERGRNTCRVLRLVEIGGR